MKHPDFLSLTQTAEMDYQGPAGFTADIGDSGAMGIRNFPLGLKGTSWGCCVINANKRLTVRVHLPMGAQHHTQALLEQQ